MALLTVKDVSKQFPGVLALHAVDLSVEAGEVHALLGENGAGKSTLVKIISGAQSPDSGQVIFNSETFEEYSPAYATSHGISVVYQRQQLVPWLSVAENILLGQWPRRSLLVDTRAMVRIARELLDRLRVHIDPGAAVSSLSPAQVQEIVIAKALYRQAKLLILDEPTAALDSEQIARLFELIRDLCAQGIGVLYISHHLEEVFQLANRMTILRDGVVARTCTPQEVSQSEVVDLMAGHRTGVGREALAVPALEVDPEIKDEAEPAGEKKGPALQLKGFSVGKVLQQLDCTVPTGQVVGVTGIVGSGTHDLALALFGLLRPFTGECLLNGKPYAPTRPSRAISRGVFLVPENPGRDGLVGVLSVAKNITLVDLADVTSGGLLQLGKEARLTRNYVEELHIQPPVIEREVRTLSGGNQQKILLAKSLQARASLLVLEEPTQGVDVNAKEEIHRIIRELAAADKAVLVVSTDIRDLLQFTDRMLVLRKGRIVADMPTNTTDYTQVLNLTLGTESTSWSQQEA